MKEITKDTIKSFLAIAGVLLFFSFLASLIIPGLIQYHRIKNEIELREPITGFYYTIRKKDLINNESPLVVKKVESEDISNLKNILNIWDTKKISEIRTTPHGVNYQYIELDSYECGRDPQDEKVTEENDSPICDDSMCQTYSTGWKGIQDRYYIYDNDEIFLLTTNFPTRCVYHEPTIAFDAPNRISSFLSLVESLHK